MAGTWGNLGCAKELNEGKWPYKFYVAWRVHWYIVVDMFNPIALRMAKTPQSFGHSECNRFNYIGLIQ